MPKLSSEVGNPISIQKWYLCIDPNFEKAVYRISLIPYVLLGILSLILLILSWGKRSGN